MHGLRGSSPVDSRKITLLRWIIQLIAVNERLFDCELHANCNVPVRCKQHCTNTPPCTHRPKLPYVSSLVFLIRCLYQDDLLDPVSFSPPICSSYSIQTGSGLSLRGESLGSFEIPRESSLGYCNRDVHLRPLRGQQTRRLKYNIKYITANEHYIQRR